MTDNHKNEAFPLIRCIRRCVEWAVDHFGLSLTQIDPLLNKICAKKTIFTFFVPRDFDLKFASLFTLV